MLRTLRILGIRGIPAAHGGFETFAEQLALYLTERGWRVVVYCQADGVGEMSTSAWQGIELVTIPVSGNGPAGTIAFDWKSVRHAARSRDLCLTLGYNTAVFSTWLRLKGVRNLINMDGLEWHRAKWSRAAKAWFLLNEWVACLSANHLIADHPEIARHLRRRVPAAKITTIAYGAKRIERPDDEPIQRYGLTSRGYLTLIARAEPENSVLEIVRAFSASRRGIRLVVLGNYDPNYPYHAAVKAAASDEVMFLGAVYDAAVVQALRFHSLAYLHGHQVGGTNPSLVEALGAGNAVIAHDNPFNRWVAGEGARFFDGEKDLRAVLDEVFLDPVALARMRRASLKRFESGLTWGHILDQYEQLLEHWLVDVEAAAPRESPAQGSAEAPVAVENSQFAVESLPLSAEDQ